MKIFIYAIEGLYQGLHGIFDQRVVEINNIEEGYMLGQEMAEELISSFGLEEEYEGTNFEPELDYLIYRISDEYTNIPIDTLEDIAYDEGYEDFVKNYCVEELS